MNYFFFGSLGALLAGMLLTFPTGCGREVERSILSAKIGEREVRAAMDGPATLTTLEEAAVISFSDQRLTIGKGRILFNGKDRVMIPPKTKIVEVDYSKGSLRVKADGASVFAARLRP